MKTVLITGPIGSGKSEVSTILRRRGYSVFDCDSECRALYESVPGLKEKAEEAAGLPFGRFRELFAKPEALASVEDVVYPELLSRICGWRESEGEVAFIESAVAASKPIFKDTYDSVLLVTAPAEVRACRNPEAARRDVLQDFSTLKADYTIENVSGLEELETLTDKYLKTI